MKSYLYVIASDNLGPCKLGFSANPSKRLKQLQTGHSDKLELFHMEEVSDGLIYEKLLHKTIGEKRKRGEWFDVSVSEAKDFITFTLIEHSPSELIP